MTAPSEMIDGLSFAAAFLLGCLFGLSLERSGVDDPRRLTGVFCLRDFAAPKVMFTAIVAASAAPYLLSDLGLLDLERVYFIPTFFWPQLVGGAVFGTGCAVSGYCPGTAVAGLASGRLDALIALAGVSLGSLLFAGVLPAIEGFYGASDPGVVTLQLLLGVNHWVVIVQQALMAGGMFKGVDIPEKRR